MQLKFEKRASSFEFFCLFSVLFKIKSSFTTDMMKKVISIRALDKWALLITRFIVFIDTRNYINQRKGLIIFGMVFSSFRRLRKPFKTSD